MKSGGSKKGFSWQKYESEKAVLAQKNLTPQEYERLIRKLAQEFRI